VSNPARTEAAAAADQTDRQSGETVQQVAVPPNVLALSSLHRVDYADAFFVETGPPRQWLAEQFVREVLDRAPLAVRAQLLLGWTAIGLIPAVGSGTRSILGWQIRQSTPGVVLLGRRSLIGMPGELLVQRERGGFLFCTFVQHTNSLARATWAAIEMQHVQTVRRLLGQAARRLVQ
jgi:hypothetical protein